MSVCGVSWLDLLHELCLQNGLALLLTATHSPAGFAEKSTTTLVNLDVVEPVPTSVVAQHGRSIRSRRSRLTGGDLIVRCELDKLDGDLDAAAELLVGLLERAQRRAA